MMTYLKAMNANHMQECTVLVPCAVVEPLQHSKLTHCLPTGSHATFHCACTCCRLKSWWDTYSGNFSIIVGDTRHGPSKIPTNVDLPHKTFGSQLVDDSQYERPDILPFSTYAACRILDTNPEDMVTNSCYKLDRPFLHAIHISKFVHTNLMPVSILILLYKMIQPMCIANISCMVSDHSHAAQELGLCCYQCTALPSSEDGSWPLPVL